MNGKPSRPADLPGKAKRLPGEMPALEAAEMLAASTRRSEREAHDEWIAAIEMATDADVRVRQLKGEATPEPDPFDLPRDLRAALAEAQDELTRAGQETRRWIGDTVADARVEVMREKIARVRAALDKTDDLIYHLPRRGLLTPDD